VSVTSIGISLRCGYGYYKFIITNLPTGIKIGGNRVAVVTRYLGFAEETTFGTAVAAVETIDPRNAELDPAGDQALIYGAVTGFLR
jgi:hypothetical protein